ncbi:MAG: class I SAM-dependent methyltransferase [Pseudomonadota bacterium]
MGIYSEKVLPRLLNCACASKANMRQRALVVPRAAGVVLEIGIGSGLNLPFYQPGRVKKVIGVDPSEEAWKLAQPRAEKTKIPTEFVAVSGEALPLEDNSVDSIVVTYALCTIPDAETALDRMRRVLRPGGQLFFLEHGLAPDESVRRWQNRLNSGWSRLVGGCNLNRDIPSILNQGGFDSSDLDTGYLRGIPRFAGYNFWGSAKAR